MPEVIASSKNPLRLVVPVLLLWLGALQTAFAMTSIQHWVTDNGARVYFVAANELPMVDVNITFNAGSARDDGSPGLAGMTSRLLDKGADGLGADEIARRVEDLGAELDTGSARDMAWVHLRTLSDTDHLEPALKLMRQVTGQPDFNSADFERERKRMIVAVRRAEQSAGDVASYTFFRAVYGDHPYATRPSGSEESLAALELTQVRDFYKRYYVAANAVIGIVGDLERPAAEALAEALSASLQKGEAAAALPPAKRHDKPTELVVAHPTTQTHIHIGQPGMHRGDPDYFSLYVGNHVLGGSGLVSLLFDEVREKRGLSYSVSSYFSPMAQDGPFLVRLQTRNDQVDEALDVVMDTLQTFMESGPTGEQLAASKKNITGGFPLRIDSNSKILDYIIMIGFYDLPLDYLETFSDKVRAVSREQVMDAFKRRLSRDSMVTVIVGSRE